VPGSIVAVNVRAEKLADAVKRETGRKGKELFMPLRMALTGRHDGPEMKVLLPLIGAEKTRARLKAA